MRHEQARRKACTSSLPSVDRQTKASMNAPNTTHCVWQAGELGVPAPRSALEQSRRSLDRPSVSHTPVQPIAKRGRHNTRVRSRRRLCTHSHQPQRPLRRSSTREHDRPAERVMPTALRLTHYPSTRWALSCADHREACTILAVVLPAITAGTNVGRPTTRGTPAAEAHLVLPQSYLFAASMVSDAIFASQASSGAVALQNS